MLSLIKKLFGGKPAEPVAEVPYKVETPAPAVEPTPVSVAATEAVVKSVAPAKKTAPKKAAPKQPQAPKTAKPKAPRKPKSKPQA